MTSPFGCARSRPSTICSRTGEQSPSRRSGFSRRVAEPQSGNPRNHRRSVRPVPPARDRTPAEAGVSGSALAEPVASAALAGAALAVVAAAIRVDVAGVLVAAARRAGRLVARGGVGPVADGRAAVGGAAGIAGRGAQRGAAAAEVRAGIGADRAVRRVAGVAPAGRAPGLPDVPVALIEVGRVLRAARGGDLDPRLLPTCTGSCATSASRWIRAPCWAPDRTAASQRPPASWSQ